MPTSPPYHLRTLGELRLSGPGGELLAGRRKELALLAYLARKSPRAVPRAELATLLWGERDEGKARQSLRHALYQLRQVLGDAVVVDNESAMVPPGAIEWDVAALERDASAERFAEAAERWQGDLLPGAEDAGDEPFRDWLEGEREALRRLAGSAFARATAAARTAADLDLELRVTRRWADAFPLESPAYTALIEALLRNGDFDEARRAYTAHESRLRRELDESPPLEFLRLRQELDRLERRSAERHPGSAALLTPDIVGRDTILASLLHLWGHVPSGGTVVVLEGGEGMGKSRLCAELVRRVRASSPAARILEASGRSPGEALRRAPDATPSLIVIDDAASASEESRASLLALAHALPPGTMLVLTRRPEDWPELSRALEMAQIAAARRIRLAPLTAKDVAALLDSMIEIGTADRDALAARLATESEGNPFYILELTSALADAGVLALLPSGRWQLDPALTSRMLPVPPNIRAAIRVRISQLGEDARVVLDAAATAGTSITTDGLSRASALPIKSFESALDQLFAHRFIRPAAEGSTGYEFTHDLIRRVAAERVIDRAGEGGGAPATQARAFAGRRRVALLLGALALIAGAIGVTRWRARASGPATAGLPRVAVLDLALVAPDSSEAWLAAGLSEEISSGLSRYEGIRIKSRGALRNRPGPVTSDPVELGRQLHVDYLVEGSLQRTGERLRVAVRLTSTRDGFQVWGRDFATALSQLPELHDRIASLIAARIGGRLAAGDSAGTRRPLTTNAQAYEHFLRGSWLLARRTPLAVEQGIEQFQQALALDSTFAAAAARIAYGYTLFIDWGWRYRGAPPEQLLREGIVLVDRALAADSASSEALLARAYLLAIRDPVTIRGALDAFERVLAIDPGNVEALYQYGQALTALGRWDEARVAYRRAIALEPERAQTYVSLASIERKMGFEELARRLYDSALVVEPGASYARSARSGLRLATGDLVGAREDAQTAVRTTQGYIIPPRSMLAAALARSGDTTAANREIAVARDAMTNRESPNPTDARWLGAALLAVGRRDEMLDLVERARPRGAWLWFYFTAQEFDSIRDDPRFVRVMKDAHPQ